MTQLPVLILLCAAVARKPRYKNTHLKLQPVSHCLQSFHRIRQTVTSTAPMWLACDQIASEARQGWCACREFVRCLREELTGENVWGKVQKCMRLCGYYYATWIVVTLMEDELSRSWVLRSPQSQLQLCYKKVSMNHTWQTYLCLASMLFWKQTKKGGEGKWEGDNENCKIVAQMWITKIRTNIKNKKIKHCHSYYHGSTDGVALIPTS